MKKILLFALPLLAMIAVSCDKDNYTYSGPTKLVKEIKVYSNPGEIGAYMSFVYDDEGRLIRVYHDYLNNKFWAYTYSEKTIEEFSEESDLEPYIIYRLNNEGYITTLELDDDTITYFYRDGYLVKTRYSDYKSEYYTWKNGNIVSTSDGWTYEYTNIENITNLDLGYFLEGPTEVVPFRWKGLHSKNLISRSILVDDNIEYTSAYEYTLDKDGAPIKIKLFTDDRPDYIIITITYVE